MINASFAARYLSILAIADRSPSELTATATSPARTHRRCRGRCPRVGARSIPAAHVYTLHQHPRTYAVLLVRTGGDPAALSQTIRLKVKELEPLRSVYDMAPLEDRIDGAFAQNRLRTVVLAMFAAAALTLACVGLYGTLSYVVSLRRREIGLRFALGAAAGRDRPAVPRQGLRVAGLACVCGLALSVAFTRLLAGMLFGVSPSDPFILSGVVGIVLAVAAGGRLWFLRCAPRWSNRCRSSGRVVDSELRSLSVRLCQIAG